MHQSLTRGPLGLRPWSRTGPSAPGISARSAYVDHFWLPLLGPTATSVARTLMRMVASAFDTVEVPLDVLAESLGMDPTTADKEITTALDRLRELHVIAFSAGGDLLVPDEFPYLQPAQVAMLPANLAEAHRATASLRPLATPDSVAPALASSGRLRTLASTVEDVLTNPALNPRQLAYRWHHVVRLAEEARDESVLDWAGPDLETTLAEGQMATQALSDAVWAAQHAVASGGGLPDDCRSTLSAGAAGIIDWMVMEFPLHEATNLVDEADL